MPNNYIVMSGFDVDSDEEVRQKLSDAKAIISSICEAVEHKMAGICKVHEGYGIVQKLPIAFFFNKFGRSTRPFYTTDACNACGICAKVCPAKTITIREGKPHWGGRCHQCLSCINRCPKRSIEFGRKTQNKGRYYFRKDFD